MNLPKFIVHLLSGGLDSVVMLYDLHAQGHKIQCLLFDYGQRHQQELNHAKRHCQRLDVQFTIICLPTLGGSLLTDGTGSFVVPFRNPIFLALAANIAATIKADLVTIACNLGDREEFPDCRQVVIDSLNQTLKLAEVNVEICAPYATKLKWEIADLGRQLGVDMDDTWSCYEGGKEPCGTCPSCQKRREALAR